MGGRVRPLRLRAGRRYPFKPDQAVQGTDWELYISQIAKEIMANQVRALWRLICAPRESLQPAPSLCRGISAKMRSEASRYARAAPEQDPKTLFTVRQRLYELLINCIPAELILKASPSRLVAKPHTRTVWAAVSLQPASPAHGSTTPRNPYFRARRLHSSHSSVRFRGGERGLKSNRNAVRPRAPALSAAPAPPGRAVRGGVGHSGGARRFTAAGSADFRTLEYFRTLPCAAVCFLTLPGTSSTLRRVRYISRGLRNCGRRRSSEKSALGVLRRAAAHWRPHVEAGLGAQGGGEPFEPDKSLDRVW